ncbi:hypothetical protein [Actinomadura bangladeshensis]|uniref:Uncharacterized protein n=1 Tax=Actinomadura bangladeshensis TaxID=453573 RepID=A0A4R4PA03_9ACTN|nr:hypothetical protein [Actinomadura bangladeshensis]TDC18919.1 hypothetical protein E1284_04925 [Actinomadura bangladeshensis]
MRRCRSPAWSTWNRTSSEKAGEAGDAQAAGAPEAEVPAALAGAGGPAGTAELRARPAGDPGSVLHRFARSLSVEEARKLREFLDRPEGDG